MYRSMRMLTGRRRWMAIPALLLALFALGLHSRMHAFAANWLRPVNEIRHVTNIPPTPALMQAGSASLGSHTLLGQEDGRGTSPALTSPIDTQASGSSFVVFNAGFTSNSNPPTDNKGNSWAPLGPPVGYNGYDGMFDIKAYVALSARGGAGHTVSIVKNGMGAGELTLPFIEIRGATALQGVVQNYPAQGPRVTSGSVTTTGPATLVALWWGDGNFLSNTAIPDSGFTVIESFVNLPPNSAVQCVVAYRQVADAGTYDVTWTESPNQGAVLWLLAFQSKSIFANGFE